MAQPDLFRTDPLPPLPPDHLRVYRVVEGHRGRRNAVLSPWVAECAGLGDRKVRQTIKELVEDHGVAIGSCSAGFFIPETPDEVKAMRRLFLAHAYSLLRRVSALDKNCDLAGILGQLKLAQEG
jgi:hypothetical protein